LRILSYDVGICNSSAPNIVKDYCKELFLKGRKTENVTVIDGVAFFDENRIMIKTCKMYLQKADLRNQKLQSIQKMEQFCCTINM